MIRVTQELIRRQVYRTGCGASSLGQVRYEAKVNDELPDRTAQIITVRNDRRDSTIGSMGIRRMTKEI